jgi:hypothetical protein
MMVQYILFQKNNSLEIKNRVNDIEDRRILSSAKKDPDAQPLTKMQHKAMVPLNSLRGRPKL